MLLSPERNSDIALAFNDQDGKRIWHDYHFATAHAESAGVGVTIWLGSNRGIDKLGSNAFVRDYVSEAGSYPQNPKQLTTELAAFLGTDVRKISRRDRNATYWKFPWICPLLDRHPLTGEILT